MLTAQQHDIFIRCAHQISSAALHGYFELSETENKLKAYNTLLEPPETIRQANADRARQLQKQMDSLWSLYKKADKASDYVVARPSILSYTSGFDGSKRTLILPGRLPDCEQAPEDEAQALAAVNEYFARDEAVSA